MPADDQVVSCPFDHSDALEFDPALVALAARGPVSRISAFHTARPGHGW